MFSPRRALVVLLVVIAAGAGVWVASAALTQVTVVYTIDEKEPASLPTAFPTPLATPFDDDCPVGVPCKVQSVVSVADVDQPADSVTSISPVALLGAPGTSIPNGDVVGKTHVVAKYRLDGDCTQSVKLTINEKADFLDGAIKTEGPADPSAAALESTTVWPTRLESDLRVSLLLASNHLLVRRSVAVIVYKPLDPLPPEIRTPINLLSFLVLDGISFGGLTMNGIYNVAVVGDPSVLHTDAMCTPMTNTGLLLGQTAAGLMLQACVAQGRHTMTTVLTHDATPNVVVDANVSDTVNCSIPVGGIAEYPEIAGPAGKSSSLPSGALAGAAAAGADGTGSSAPGTPLLAGLAAGGALLLAGGAWYARRRRLS